MKFLYVIKIRCDFELRRRNEFGWIDGREPGNGRFEESICEENVLSPNEDLARQLALSRYEGDGKRNAEIISVIRFPITISVNVEYHS